MGKVFACLDDRMRDWIGAQAMFFVATAPSDADGRINVSPKGHADTFAVLDGTTVAYLDLTGSGVETIAHLRDNGRITVMFCAFDGPPRIVRLYGTGRVVEPCDDEWGALASWFPPHHGARAVVLVDVERIADSCGYSVPRYELVEQRDVLERWAARKDEAGLAAYRAQKNETSIDGLPALVSLNKV